MRIRNGEALVTDGPFAETKELLGGYFLVECADVDEAIEWAARIPTAEYGSIGTALYVAYHRDLLA